MKTITGILILGSLLSTGLLGLPSEKTDQSAPALATGEAGQPASPVLIGEVLRAHNASQNPDVLSVFDAEAVRLTSRPPGIDRELPSFFERHVSVVWSGNAYKRHTADPLKLREQFDLFDGKVSYHAATESGRLIEEANQMTDSQFWGVEFGVKTFGLVPVLKQLSDPATEVVYLGRTAYRQDKFDVKTATGRWALYTDMEHLISRIEAGGRVIEYANYRSVDGVQLPFIQRIFIGGHLAQELFFTRITLNPKLPPDCFRHEAILKEIAH